MSRETDREPKRELGAGALRADFLYQLPIATRWGDNDSYGHINNARYYTFFEQVIMHFLEREAGLLCQAQGVQVFTVENGCQYHQAIAYPTQIEAGLRVVALGRSSVQYRLGLFAQGEPSVCATGRVVDVFVDPASQRPTPIPPAYRQAFERLHRPLGSA